MKRRLYRDRIDPPDHHQRAFALEVLRRVRPFIQGLPGGVCAFPRRGYCVIAFRRRILWGGRDRQEDRWLEGAVSPELLEYPNQLRAFMEYTAETWRRDVEQYG